MEHRTNHGFSEAEESGENEEIGGGQTTERSRLHEHIRGEHARQEPQVLQPDNPLMTSFQEALKAHLNRQYKQLQEHICGLKLEQKEKSKIFNGNMDIRELEQKAVFRQNLLLEKERGEIEKILDERVKIEANLKTKYDCCKEVSQLLTNKNNKQQELRLEKESLATLVKQFSEWEECQNSEITISQHVSGKNKSDKNIYTQDKLYQDILLLKLTSEVLKLMTNFNELDKNIKQKQSEVKAVSQAVADGNADLEGLENENKKLMCTWNCVIVKIQQRDRIMADTKGLLLESQHQYRSLMCEVESFKRSSAVEVKCNEALTQTMVRLQDNVELLERVHSAEEEKQSRLRQNLVQVATIVEFTQRDLDILLNSSKEKEAKCNVLQTEADKLKQLMSHLERQIDKKLYQQAVLSKAERENITLVSELRTKARLLDTQLYNAQNELARLQLNIEIENKLIKERMSLLDEEKLADLAREKEFKNLEACLKQQETTIMRKQCLVDDLNIKIADINQRNQGEDLSQGEMEIKSLERSLAVINDHIEELQSSWMREQSSIVELSQQQNSLLNKLNIHHKRTLIMKQKQMRIELEINHQRTEESNMKRLQHTLENRLTNLNLQCSERKGYKETLNSQNLVSQNQLICDLKDAEVKALTIQEEMCYLEVEKEELRTQIEETQRELLAWEKKFQLATEVKASIDRAKAEGGEVSIMKAEIHRMEVRHAQLQKVQKKLAYDMEMCISRRDSIVDLAQAREKRTTKQAFYTRQQFLKKLEDLKKKITQTNTEQKSVEKMYNAAEVQINILTDKKLAGTNQLAELENAVSQMQAQLTEGQFHKQKNLELLVRKQRKARQYGELKAGRYNLMFRQLSVLELETQKQKSINADLLSLVESLSNDFPLLESPITQIMNTLRSPAA